jgi:hypothetical protein
MKTTFNLKARRAPRPGPAVASLLASIALAGALHAATALNPPVQPAGGGITAQATITSTLITTTNATICWYGNEGFYGIEASTDMITWVNVGSVLANKYSWCATVPNTNGTTNVFYRLNQANSYVGSGSCAGCHGDKFSEWIHTGHATAISRLQDSNGVISAFFDASCVKCHSVGKGQPTGFQNLTTTPHLANVGCESCHGPAGWHKYSDKDLVHPSVTADPKLCGSCHQDSHHPTYEEYSETLHAEVNDDIKYGFAGGVYVPDTINVGGTNWYGYYLTTNANGTLRTNRTTGIIASLNGPQTLPSAVQLYDPGQDRAASCGVCHSAETRAAMLKDYSARLAGKTNALVMPEAHASAEWSATCVTCHDPHSDANVAQLRYPIRSTNYYTMPTTTDKRTNVTVNFQGGLTTNVVFMGTTFASMFDPNIQVCGQCHNTRGARWDGKAFGLITNNGAITVGVTPAITGYGRPPHHSGQYNMLIGIVQPDYLNTNALGVATNMVGVHGNMARNTNGCAACHVPSYSVNATTMVTGHSFEMDKRGCNLAGCHTGGIPDVEGYMYTTTNKVAAIVDLLRQWATTKGPGILTTNYSKHKENSWEFTTIGQLATVTNAGPSTADQLKLPEAIRQARFNIYMVAHDGSWGVHNTRLTPLLLRDAETKVLNQFTVAKFNVANPFVWTNAPVTFTNLNPAVLSCTWNYGDGTTGTSTAASHTHAYANPGLYTVTLEATDATGTETLVRTNLVVVYNKPSVGFTMTPNTGTAPLTVTFSNTTTDATYYRWSFMANVTNTLYSNEQNPTFTYTNAGTYHVALRGYNEGGSVTITNVLTVTP